MKKIFILTVLFILPLCMMAQQEEDTENGVVSLAGKEGFTIGTKKGDFLFKPYLLVQTSATVNYYDDEGLDKAYNQDNVAMVRTPAKRLIPDSPFLMLYSVLPGKHLIR